MAMIWRILVAALVLGSLGCDREEEETEKQRQEQAFVAAVGRSPSPGKINDAGRTDLHRVAQLNLPMLAISLLKQGANVHAKNNRGWTPLHIAAWFDASATAEVLLQRGANVHAKDNDGLVRRCTAAAQEGCCLRPPRSCSSKGPTSTSETTRGFTPLHGAAQADAVCDRRGLAPARGQRPRQRQRGLVRRCTLRQQKDASATAEVLLQQGANVNAKNNRGSTPLHAAARMKDAVATAEVLLKQGANVHAIDNKGETPLHLAAIEDASATAEVLLQQGANVHAKTNEGHTPLYFAAAMDVSATAEVLRRYGARRR